MRSQYHDSSENRESVVECDATRPPCYTPPMPDEDPNARFDALLQRMAHGQAPSGQTTKPADQASDAARDACSSDTQTPRDTSEGDER